MLGPFLRGGDGWLKTLWRWCRFLHLPSIPVQHSSMRTRMSSAPTTDPITMPAIAPPDKPRWADWPFAAAAEVPVAEGAPLLVEDGKRGGIDEVVGSVTPAQRFVTFEPIQQESVAFGELAAQ